MGLGSLKDFSQKEARDRARQKRQLLADGIDPLAQKEANKAAKALAKAKAITFEEAARQFFDQHSKTPGPRTKAPKLSGSAAVGCGPRNRFPVAWTN